MNPQSLNPYVYCMNNPLKYVDPNGRDHIVPLLEDYVHDPLLSPIPIDTSTYRSTLLSIHRVENRMYELRSKISEINLSGEYEEYLMKWLESIEQTNKWADPNNWANFPPKNPKEILLFLLLYMPAFDYNMIKNDYYLSKIVRLQKYKKRYMELSETYKDLHEALESFNNEPEDNAKSGGSLPGGGGHKDIIPI